MQTRLTSRSFSNQKTLIHLIKQMPPDVADSFTAKQIEHLNRSLASNQWKKHPIDIRSTLSLPFVRYRFYFVFLAGRNRRSLSRQEEKISRFMLALFIALYVFVSVLFGLLLLYLLKSAAGINLFEGFSLGIWDYFKDLF